MKNKLIFFIIFFFLSACAPSPSQATEASISLAPVPPEFSELTNPLGEESAVVGAEVYKTYCVSCHGETGRGDGASGTSLTPKPKDLWQVNALAKDGFLFWRISEGSSGTAMIAWKGILTEEQVWQVVAFIRTLK